LGSTAQTHSTQGVKVWANTIQTVVWLLRTTVDAVARRLRGEGLVVAAYHAALPAATRADVLLQWRAGQLQVVVASVAFGMGVDKGVW
jgi:superfamily II DNA helicase RecQ